jgi:hypothetical protein
MFEILYQDILVFTNLILQGHVMYVKVILIIQTYMYFKWTFFLATVVSPTTDIDFLSSRYDRRILCKFY